MRHFALKVFAITATIIFADCSSTRQPALPTTTPTPGAVMSPAEFQALPAQPADFRLAYGADANQYGELKVPASGELHPVVVLIHGGCWKAAYATLRDLAPMADALKREGIASWNIEYRRLPQPSSGYPGTYLDVAHAVDHLRDIAATHRLDLRRVVVIGHSAGGHLALWTAARTRLQPDSPLYVANPLPLRGVVNLAGYGDLAAFQSVEQASCNEAVVTQILGGQPAAQPDRYAQTSAIKLLPLGVPQVVVWGASDAMTPLWLGENYVKAATQAGDNVRLATLPGLGHFEVASPHSTAWPVVREALQALLK